MSAKTVGESRTKEALSEFSESKNGSLILTVLILGAILAMINLSMGNIALPSIAMTFNTTGTQQNWITDGFTLAMAAIVIYFGDIGDRYGVRSCSCSAPLYPFRLHFSRQFPGRQKF